MDNSDLTYLEKASANFYDSNTGVTVRSPMGREIYNKFRPNEAIPSLSSQTDLQSIMFACNDIYKRIGLIRTTIDYMTELAVAGIDIHHENASAAKFYKEWFKKTNMQERAERFLSWFFKTGNVVVKREWANLDLGISNPRIPVGYKFYHPGTIQLIGDFYGTLAEKRYGIKVPLSHFQALQHPKTPLEQKIWETLPEEIKKAIKGQTDGGVLYLPIDSDNLYVDYYKKDDTDIWAVSFLYSILQDVYYIDKLKLAKTAALDGFINVIRLWKLGDHKEQIFPSSAIGAKLAGIISQHTGGGSMDIIWDSAIDLKEYYPPIKDLAEFEEDRSNLLLGLGISESFVGSDNNKSSNSLGMINIKVLLQRIEYGRRALVRFILNEAELINEEMRFKKLPTLSFSYKDFFDERTYLEIVKELMDRNIISNRRVLEILNENPSVEIKQIQVEDELRKNGDIPAKASPFHNPQLEMQQKHEIDKMNSTNMSRERFVDKPKGGRPYNSRDSKPRLRKASVEQHYSNCLEETVKIANEFQFSGTEFNQAFVTLFFNVPIDQQFSEFFEKANLNFDFMGKMGIKIENDLDKDLLIEKYMSIYDGNL